MGFVDFMKSVGRGINKGLKATRIISTLAPIAGAVVGGPMGGAAGTALGRGIASLGYEKGGRIPQRKPVGFKRGGRVKGKGKKAPKNK